MDYTSNNVGKKNTYSSILLKLNTDSDIKYTFIGLAVIVCTAGLLIYNAFFGIGIADESFYFTIPYRFLLGDRPFIDEWHVSQLSAILQYPLVWLLVKLTGGADGIILYFRLWFIICQVAVSCYLFYKLKKRGFLSALLGALLFELYIPEYTLTLDYYTLSMFPTTIISLILIFDEKISPIRLVLCGVLYACSVLAEPLFSIAFFLWVPFVLAFSAKNKRPHILLSLKSLIYISLGIAAVAGLLFSFLFSRESPADFFAALPNIWNSGEYSGNTLLIGFPYYFRSLYRDFSWGIIVFGVFLFVIIVDKGRKTRKTVWSFVCFVIAAVCVIIALSRIIKTGTILSVINFPTLISIVGFSSFMLINKKDYQLLALWIVGVVYSFLLALTSEAMDYIGSYGFVLSGASSVCMIIELCIENTVHKINKKKNIRTKQSKFSIVILRVTPYIATVLCAFVLCAYSGVLLLRDPTATVLDRDMLTETVSVDNGAYKGIRISPEQKQVYDAILIDIDSLEHLSDGRYTVISDNAWYLYSSSKRPLSFTLWYMSRAFYSPPSDLNSYINYYDYTGELPEYIYIINKCFYYSKTGRLLQTREEINFFNSYLIIDTIDGRAGYFMKINGKRL